MDAVATDKAKVTAYIEADLRAEIDELCRLRNRSISNLVETLLREAIKQAKDSGELPKH